MDVIQRHSQSQLAHVLVIVKALGSRSKLYGLALLLLFSSLTQAQAIEKPLVTKNTVPKVEVLPQQQVETVLVLGDSISAAFGLNKSKGWVSLLEKELSEQYRFINASISGDTTTGGRHRLKRALLEHRPNLVIIELGGNDGLRGTPLKQIRNNIQAMVESARKSGARVMLLGMRIPPNYGERYTSAFANIYIELAEQMDTLYVPFFLEGVAGVEGMMQADGIHPTEAAQETMMLHVKRAFDALVQP